MILRSPALRQTPAWQSALARAITDPAELLTVLELDARLLPAARAAARLFPLRAPRGYVARMRKGDAADPLLRQVLPLDLECESAAGFTADPVGDLAALAVPGVLHKYHGRVLLTATGACAVHCRYCFRRHFPYADASASTDQWRGALDYVRHDRSLKEVILSGGDPLSLSDRRLSAFVRALARIPHVERLRIHTRLPIVLPERIDDDMLAWLTGTRLHPVMVVHANHANELDDRVVRALSCLHRAGVTLLNQSVLLKGVNDSAEALIALSEALMAARVLPYYLHLLDRVAGAAHFEVDESRARALMRAISARLPGYLVPRLAREEVGGQAKRVLGTEVPGPE